METVIADAGPLVAYLKRDDKDHEAEVYSVLGYVLHHQAEVAAYLAGRAEDRSAVREENERRFDPQGIRARLLARPRPTPQEG
jgi:hypothetical protein